MSDLRSDLASLRIDDRPKPRSPWRWPLLLLVPLVIVLAVLYGLRARQAFSAVEVEIGQTGVSAPAAGGQPGAAILTASGYVVARRKAVVSAKIQGRLSELKVEEGSHVRDGEVIARLESEDAAAQVERASAAAQGSRFSLACRACPRLASHLDRVRAEHPGYHARPVPAFGDAAPQLLVGRA